MSETKQPENPQAFPSGDAPYHHGMTLRDYFAGQALTGAVGKSLLLPDGNPVTNAYGLAQWAYIIADAMLLARGDK